MSKGTARGIVPLTGSLLFVLSITFIVATGTVDRGEGVRLDRHPVSVVAGDIIWPQSGDIGWPACGDIGWPDCDSPAPRATA